MAAIAATAALNAFPAPDPHPEKPVSAECAEYIADTETQLAKAKVEGNEDGVLAFTRTRVGARTTAAMKLDHFSGDR